MRAIIFNFRGIENLDTEIAGVLLLAGANGAGKTSACQAIAAAASGVLLPFEGLTKAKAALLVHDGAKDAVVELGEQGNAARVRWPVAERDTVGTFRDASKIAVGLESPVLMSPKDRAAWLVSFLAALPDAGTIARHLTDAGIPEDRADAVVQSVATNGWDKAHAAAKEDGARLKGQWERVTGERFGAQKAQSWCPAGYTEADDREPETSVNSRVQQWQTTLNEAIAKQAVDAAVLASLRDLAAQVEPLQAELATAQRDADEKNAAVESATKARAACPPVPDVHHPVECPHCGGQLIVIGDHVEATTLRAESSEKLVEDILAKIATADQAVAAARGPAMEAERRLVKAQRDLKAARDAAEKLAAAPVPQHYTVDEARAGLQAAEAKRTAWLQVREARELAAKIEQQVIIVKALADDGIRQTVLAERLGEFNGELVSVCRQAGWGWVNIQSDLSLTYAGRPYSLCSGGEQFRVRVTLQIAVARRENAPLLVIDGADILDRAGRNGLLGMLADVGIPAVVGITLLRREEMPDLAGVGIGSSVWIERGAAHVAAKAAAWKGAVA